MHYAHHSACGQPFVVIYGSDTKKTEDWTHRARKQIDGIHMSIK